MKQVIMVMSKSAWPEGRHGSHEDQDWFLVVKEAVRLYKESKVDALLLAVTGMKSSLSVFPEIFYYTKALRSFGLTEGVDFVSLPKGIDTITQIEEAFLFTDQHQAELTIVSTKLHILRVRWVCFWAKRKVKHLTPSRLGIPRREEIFNDIFMMIALPVIDVLGLRSRFMEYISKRRATGKL